MFAQLRAMPYLFLRPLQIVRSYRLSDLRPDTIAGLTVAIISLPQAIAYGLVAGLTPQMGLYTAIVGPIVGAFWGSSSQIQTSPTTALSLLGAKVSEIAAVTGLGGNVTLSFAALSYADRLNVTTIGDASVSEVETAAEAVRAAWEALHA